jgi:hypothetical protein
VGAEAALPVAHERAGPPRPGAPRRRLRVGVLLGRLLVVGGQAHELHWVVANLHGILDLLCDGLDELHLCGVHGCVRRRRAGAGYAVAAPANAPRAARDVRPRPELIVVVVYVFVLHFVLVLGLHDEAASLRELVEKME